MDFQPIPQADNQNSGRHAVDRKTLLKALESFLSRKAFCGTAFESEAAYIKKDLSSRSCNELSAEILIEAYEKVILHLEDFMATNGHRPAWIYLHKQLFSRVEQLTQAENKERHSFLVVIPVADRPVMLENCLKSLLRQCRIFNYGGKSTDSHGRQVFPRVHALIVDDSRDINNIAANRKIAVRITRAGIRTGHFNLSEQSRIVKGIPDALRRNLKNVLGESVDGVSAHKGASVTRNIAFLYLARYLSSLIPGKALIYFIDSDEEFGISPGNSKKPGQPVINYFYWLDKLFTTRDIQALTGKVVGDPPVSPAVMINRFLDDLLLFFREVHDHSPGDSCIFHGRSCVKHTPSHYHDMVAMFGYENSGACNYSCTLEGNHTIRDTLADFAHKMGGFFNGRHPTRKTRYSFNGGPLHLVPARTVYTGNYVIRAAALRYFIPYAGLKLRMAGPALGRLLQSRIGQQFVSANLPLLHNRVLACTDKGEFRAGVKTQGKVQDLSEEFKKQFWGDVLLFSTEELIKCGYPDEGLDSELINKCLDKVKTRIWEIYFENNRAASKKLCILKELLMDERAWWHHSPDLRAVVDSLKNFLSNAELNFGLDSNGFNGIKRTLSSRDFQATIVKALYDLPKDEIFWNRICGPQEGESFSDFCVQTGR